ncbi:unnamed protein product, partial [Effrenium voratum]
VNSSTHRKEYAKLTRLINNGTVAHGYPNCHELANGSLKDRQKLLQQFVCNGQNIEACEGKLEASKTQELEGKKRYALVPVKDMKNAPWNFSQRKIAAIISKGGGIEDEDCPGVLEETRFWVLAEHTRTDTVAVKMQESMSMRTSASHALTSIMGTGVNPSLERAPIRSPSAPLSGDVLRAYDNYNQQLQSLVADEGAPRTNKSGQGQSKKSAPSAISRSTAKKPLLEQTFNTEKEKHQRWSNEVKKELKDIAGFLVDMPSDSELTKTLKRHQRALKTLASKFKDLKTFQEMEPACTEIAQE